MMHRIQSELFSISDELFCAEVGREKERRPVIITGQLTVY